MNWLCTECDGEWAIIEDGKTIGSGFRNEVDATKYLISRAECRLVILGEPEKEVRKLISGLQDRSEVEKLIFVHLRALVAEINCLKPRVTLLEIGAREGE